MANGYQHGHYSFAFDIFKNISAGIIYAYVEIDDNSSFTSPTTILSYTYTQGTVSVYHVISGLFSGSTSSADMYITIKN